MLYKKRRKYKYTLFRTEKYETDIVPDEAGVWGPLAINVIVILTVSQGYALDGQSGPAIDSHTFMRGSLIHDCLYQLMREQKIGQQWRKRADEILRDICIVDGMAKIRAAWVYRAVRIGAAKSAKPDLLNAPRRRSSL